jgi:GntR family histidine utilization transcriptional repressor
MLVHFEDDTAIQLEERYVNPAFAPHYVEVNFASITPARYLRELSPPTEVEHIIFAGFPNAPQRRILGLRSGDPCLFLMRRTWCAELAATRSLFVYPAGRYSLGSRYRVTGSGTPVVTA